MIGSVTITRPEGTAVAVLAEDGRWSYVGDRTVADHLRSAVAGLDDDYAGPSQGAYGESLLKSLHDIAGGELAIELKTRQPAGTIY